jgi:hypothetical protein
LREERREGLRIRERKRRKKGEGGEGEKGIEGRGRGKLVYFSLWVR